MNFLCSSCGACCREVGRNGLLPDRGDGACAHLATDDKTCTIYDDRPDICDVGKVYKLLELEISEKEFFQLNTQICHEMIEHYELGDEWKIDLKDYDE